MFSPLQSCRKTKREASERLFTAMRLWRGPANVAFWHFLPLSSLMNMSVIGGGGDIAAAFADGSS